MLRLEFVEQIAKLIVLEALLYGLSDVAAEAAYTAPGPDSFRQLGRQRDADLLGLAAHAWLWISLVRGRRVVRQHGKDMLNDLLA